MEGEQKESWAPALAGKMPEVIVIDCYKVGRRV